MDFLTEIIELKAKRLEAAKTARPFGSVKDQALGIRSNAFPHALHASLSRPQLNIIAEVKRASPSLGLIKGDADPAKIAAEYESGGAAAVSVLTEEDRFKGSLDDLRNVRAVVKIPVLRKDFIFDEYQLYESAAAGADALLLIVAALNDGDLTELIRITESNLRMDALVEVHTPQEIERAVKAGARLIGVNNRDLRTFKVSLDTSFELVKDIPSDAIAVTESGLKTRDDLRNLAGAGFRGFLIGETLMRSGDPKAALLKLIEDPGTSELHQS